MTKHIQSEYDCWRSILWRGTFLIGDAGDATRTFLFIHVNSKYFNFIPNNCFSFQKHVALMLCRFIHSMHYFKMCCYFLLWFDSDFFLFLFAFFCLFLFLCVCSRLLFLTCFHLFFAFLNLFFRIFFKTFRTLLDLCGLFFFWVVFWMPLIFFFIFWSFFVVFFSFFLKQASNFQA